MDPVPPATPDPGLRQALETLRLRPSQRTAPQITKLAALLRGYEGFLHSLSQADCEIVCRWLEYEFVAPGAPVYTEGSLGEAMYIVVSGTCEVSSPKDTATPAGKSVLHRGEAFGHLALIHPRAPRTRTVTAAAASSSSSGGGAGGGDNGGGVHLAVLPRSTINHMRFVGDAQPEVGRALQAVLCACCISVLRVPQGARSGEEVELLAAFLQQLEAFRQLPAGLVSRLAADCSHVRLPANTLLFEEDSAGNAMYVVASGQCAVRARPLSQRASGRNTSSKLQQQQSHKSTRVQGSHGRASGVNVGWSQRPSYSGVGAGVGAGSGGPGEGAESMAGVTTLVRFRVRHERTTPSDAVGEGDGDSSEQQDAEQQQQAAASSNKNSPFWIARFMADAMKRLGGPAPAGGVDGPTGQSGHGPTGHRGAGLGQDGSVTPLAAVAAARWRQTALGSRRQRLSEVAEEGPGGGGEGGEGAGVEEEEGEVVQAAAAGAEGAMEALLGRAAAKALRRAATESRAWEREQEEEEQLQRGVLEQGAAGNGQPVGAEAAVAAVGDNGEDAGGAPGGQEASAAVPGAVAAAAAAAVAPRPMRGSYWGAASTATGVTGSGVAGGMGMAVEDPAKRLLLQLGSKDPANASRALLSELVQRADVNVVLYEVAKRLMRNGGGGPQRVTRKTSRKIADALNRQIRTGTDRMDTVSGQRVLGRSASVHDRTAMAGPYGGLPRRESQSSGVGLSPTGEEGSYYGGVRASHDGQRPPSAQTGSYGAASVWGGLTFGSDGEGSDGYDEDGSASFDMDDFAGSELSYGMVSYAHSAASHRRRAMYDLPELAHVRSLGTATPSELDAAFGPTLRTVAPGQSFGELALLHRDSRRTASVIALGSGAQGAQGAQGPEEQVRQQRGLGSGAGRRSAAWRASSFGAADPRSDAAAAVAAATAAATTPCLSAEPSTASVAPSARHSTSPAPNSWVDLIVVPRQVYNHTVRGLQRAQLQGLLGFLSGLPPFRGMDERQLAALAVFCRTREAAAGEVLAARGQPQEELWMVQEGEVVLLDDSAAVTQPLGPGAGLPPHARSAPGPGWRALHRALSNPEDSPGLLQRLAAQPGPRPAALQRNGRSLGRQVSVAAVREARYGSGSGVQQESGAGGRRAAFEGRVGQGEGEAGSKGGAGEGGMRHVAPGVLKGATLSSMGPGGMFGEGVLKRVVGEVEQQQLMQAMQQQYGGRRGGGQGDVQVHARPAPGAPYPCTVVARRPCKLLVLSAADLCRFAHEVLEPLSRLAAARGELLVQRSSSVAAAQEAVSERVEAGRKLLSDVRTQLARGLPVASNAKLSRALQEELLLAVEANTQEQQLLQEQEDEQLQGVGGGQGQGQVRLVSKAGLKADALRRGGRERPRLQLPGVGVVVDMNVMSLVLGGGGPRVAREPHPLSTRLEGVLQQGSPVLPPPVVVGKVPTPTPTRPASGAGADGGQGHLLTQWWGQQGEQEEGQEGQGEGEASAGAVGPGGGPVYSLSTIVEESSATLRVHAGVGAAGVVGGQGEEESFQEGVVEEALQHQGAARAEASADSLLVRCKGSRGSSLAASHVEGEEAPGALGRGDGAGGTEGQLEALGRAVADVQHLVGQVQQAVANTQPATSRTPSRVPSMKRQSPSTMMPAALSNNVGMAPLVVPASPVSPGLPTSPSGRQLPPLSSRPPSFVTRETSASSLASGAPTPTGLSYTSQGTPPYGSAHTSGSGGLLPPLPASGPPSLRRTNSDSAHRRASSGYRLGPSPRQHGSSADGGAVPPPQLYPIPSLDSAPQASLHSYPSLGPTASVTAAGLPSAGHSTTSIGSNSSRRASGTAAGAVLPYDSNSSVGAAALAAVGGSLGGVSVYTDDDGAPSPELSRVPRELQLARSPSAMAANHLNHPNHPTNVPLLPSLLPYPRPAGRIHRSSSGSSTGPRGPSLAASPAGTSPDAEAAQPPAAPWQLGSPSARRSASPTAVPYGEEAVLMEAMGASLERVSGGRPVRMRSRSGGFSNDGSWPVVLVGPQARRASVTGGAGEVVHGSLWVQAEQAGETVWHDGEQAGQEGNGEGEEGEGDGQPRLVLPFLVLPRLVGDGGGVPEACSPRAAALFGVRGGGGFDSPVHSPRLVSTVY